MAVVPLAIESVCVLREIANSHFVSPLYRARIDGKFPVHVVNVPCRVAHERFEERSLARTVAPDQRDFFAALDVRSEGQYHFQIAIRFREALALERVASRRRLHVKTDIRP